MIKKSVQGRFLAHKQNRLSSCSTHQCSNNCFRNIPLQTCGNICDAIATTLGAICGLDQVLWRQFPESKSATARTNCLDIDSNRSCRLFETCNNTLADGKACGLQMLGRTNSPHFEQLMPSTASDDTSDSYQPTYEEELQLMMLKFHSANSHPQELHQLK